MSRGRTRRAPRRVTRDITGRLLWTAFARGSLITFLSRRSVTTSSLVWSAPTTPVTRAAVNRYVACEPPPWSFPQGRARSPDMFRSAFGTSNAEALQGYQANAKTFGASKGYSVRSAPNHRHGVFAAIARRVRRAMDAAIRLEQGVDGWRVSRRPQRVFVVERRCHGQPTLQPKCPPSHSTRARCNQTMLAIPSIA